MMPERRQEELLRMLAVQEYLSVDEAVLRTRASAATIRRDFGELSARGLVLRTRGGLRRLQAGEALPQGRAGEHGAEKAAIARAAAALLMPEDVVLVDGGTTTAQIHRYLPAIPLKIITNSLRLASALAGERERGLPVEVVLTGGTLEAASGLLVGPQTVMALEQYHAQWALLSSSGICADGVFNTSEFVAESERVMIRNAERSVVLADASKVGRRSLCRVVGLESISGLITVETAANRDALKAIEGAGVRVTRLVP
ncbi:MAG: DeoR/GlpR transcriptional regulator [Candidatus Hydrogenedentes bacterium]|nr:DeoR/GlpR transcriptional regulator [Candidatus Hydrogenedentota bacterium]